DLNSTELQREVEPFDSGQVEQTVLPGETLDAKGHPKLPLPRAHPGGAVVDRRRFVFAKDELGAVRAAARVDEMRVALRCDFPRHLLTNLHLPGGNGQNLRGV